METKKTFITEVPVSGQRKKMNVQPLAELFVIFGKEDILEMLREILCDCPVAYARSLENGSEEDMFPDLLGNLYCLKVLIKQIEQCNYVNNDISSN